MPPIDPARTDQAVDQRMRAEQLVLLFRQSRKMELVSPVMGVVLCIGMWPTASHALLLGWLALLIAMAVVRLVLARRFQRPAVEMRNLVVWEHRFVASFGVVGLLWGVGGWLLMPGDSLFDQVFVYVFLIGVAGGTTATFAVHPRTVTVAAAAMIGPAVLYFVWLGSAIHYCLAFGGALLVWAIPSGLQVAADILRKSMLLAQQLDRLASVDPLSGLATRRAFTDAGQQAIAQAGRSGSGCALLMIDVDHFKAINDRFGHAGGDKVIAGLGALLSDSVRAGETAGRLGGEEFAVVLPNARLLQAQLLAERILERIRSQSFPIDSSGDYPVRVSIGVADSSGEPATLQDLLTRADAALYEAKSEGRNRVVAAAPQLPTPPSTDPAWCDSGSAPLH